jgi:hypothetical protein
VSGRKIQRCMGVKGIRQMQKKTEKKRKESHKW